MPTLRRNRDLDVAPPCGTKAGKIEYRVDKRASSTFLSVRCRSMPTRFRITRACYGCGRQGQASTAKGKYVKKVNLAATMGPGVLLDETAYIK